MRKRRKKSCFFYLHIYKVVMPEEKYKADGASVSLAYRIMWANFAYLAHSNDCPIKIIH